MKKILIVEDDELTRQALSDVLADKGYELTAAENGQEGYDIALRVHPDLILLDYFMPIKSGLEFVEELRKDAWGQTAQVVFLTNNADTQVLSAALQNKVTDYLLKADMSSEAIVTLVKDKLGE
jgi:two-component system chemotaxis response regulator CheY